MSEAREKVTVRVGAVSKTVERTPPTGGSGVAQECEHKFTFLRQETEPSDIDSYRTDLRQVVDIFFCEHCLATVKKKVRLEQQSRERFGWDVVQRF